MMAGFIRRSRGYVHNRLARKRIAITAPSKPTEKQAKQALDLSPRPFEFRGAVKALWELPPDINEVLIEGPAGTGKTLGILAWIYQQMDAYPGLRVLMIRKVRESMTNTVLVTWEQQVVPRAHPMLKGNRKTRSSYLHVNGSELELGSLNNAKAVEKVLSSEYDIIYVPEALEITQADYQTLTTRLRGSVREIPLLICDLNPGHPAHHLNRRANAGHLHRLKSRHEDNPRWHDGRSWTVAGKNYLEKILGKMSGLQRNRFLLGIWAASDGVIYDTYDPAKHEVPTLVKAGPLPYEWRRVWVIDFGYTNPFVWLQLAIDPDERIWIEFQIYRTKALLKDHAAMIKQATENVTPPPIAFICDHDAQDRAELEALLGVKTEAAFKAVSAGIDAVKTRLEVRGDGRPGLLVMEDSLVHEPDPHLLEAGRPVCIQDEFGAYVWAKNTSGAVRDEPRKEDDHAMDTLRYGVAWVDRVGDPHKGDPGFGGRVIRRVVRR